MLLLGLGLTPSWTDRHALPPDGLYYGPEPDSVEAAVRVRLSTETAAYFRTRTAFDPARMAWLTWDGDEWPLPVESPDAEPDVIASTFFWLAGWPEYTTTARDQHGRYAYAGSLQERLDMALVPVVDAYRGWLRDRLTEVNFIVPGRTWGGKTWAVAWTVDVDFVRTRRLGILARGLRAGRPGAILDALAPGDARSGALDALGAFLGRDGGTVFMKADASAPEDVAYRLDAPRVRRFLDTMQTQGVEIGLHPSYAAFNHPGRLATECDHLAAVLGQTPACIRSHYLRWQEPTTPRLYHQEGFHIDSTLGYSRQEGFRRGTCHPYRLYDLGTNQALDLWEVPVVVMDTSLLIHQALAVDEATARLRSVLLAARRVQGCAVLLWHNDPQAGASPDGFGILAAVLDIMTASEAATGGLPRLLSMWKSAGH